MATLAAACLVCGSARLDGLAPGHVACRECGFTFAPTFDDGVIMATYAELRRSGRDRTIETCRQPLYETVLSRTDGEAGRRCLDVGCGAGTFVRLAAGRGWIAVGIDPLADPVDTARARLLRARFPSADLGASRFDLVTFFNSLNYLEDPLEALRETRRLLHPGGLIVIRVPNASLHRAILALARRLDGIPAAAAWLGRLPVLHPRSFSPRSLGLLLRRSGFHEVRVEASASSDGDPYETGPASWALKAIVGRAAVTIARLSGERIVWTPSLFATGRALDVGPGEREPRGLR